MACRLYVFLCRRYRRCHLTFSASAWLRGQNTGRKRWRNFIDGIWLALFNTHNHCQSSYQRETSAQPRAVKGNK